MWACGRDRENSGLALFGLSRDICELHVSRKHFADCRHRNLSTRRRHVGTPELQPKFRRTSGKWAEHCFKNTVSEERTRWVLRQARWVLQQTRWVHFGAQRIGWEDLTELSPWTRWRQRNSLSLVFETCSLKPYSARLRASERVSNGYAFKQLPSHRGSMGRVSSLARMRTRTQLSS